MKTSKQKFAKYARMYALGLWGVLSILYIAGEPIDEDMPFGTFCLLKLVGLVSLGLCVAVGIRLRKAGLMPTSDGNHDCKI